MVFSSERPAFIIHRNSRRNLFQHKQFRGTAQVSPCCSLLLILFSLLFYISTSNYDVVVLAASSASANSLYSTLGVTKSATPEEIKSAYRRAALKHHPDKVPDADRVRALREFKEIGRAYECLSDARKRGLYDRYGERSLEAHFRPTRGAGGRRAGAGGVSGGCGPFGGRSGGGDFANVDLNDILRQMTGGVTLGDLDRSRRGNPSLGSGGEFGNSFGGHYGRRTTPQQQKQQRRRSNKFSSVFKNLFPWVSARVRGGITGIIVCTAVMVLVCTYWNCWDPIFETSSSYNDFEESLSSALIYLT